MLCASGAVAQSNNAMSIFEGDRILSVEFDYTDPPADSAEFRQMREKVEGTFLIEPYTHFNRMQTEYYLSQVRNLPFVKEVSPFIMLLPEGGLKIVVSVVISPTQQAKTSSGVFTNIKDFPVLFSRKTNFITLRFAAAEMMYSNNNAWFAEPSQMLAGNPLADNGAAGKGYTGWLDGFAMGGIYGITRIIPALNLHVYGGASYIASFSVGNELFTNKSRFHGGVEDAYVGIVGGKKLSSGREYSYNISYGRKLFVLGNGWLIVNTSMNGYDRAALQLNARTAARRLFTAGFRTGIFTAQIFQMRPDELDFLNSRTVINGLNLEVNDRNMLQLAASVLYSPRSNYKYYFPDGTSHTRKGLWVYNIRAFGNPPQNEPGVFFKTELGYQHNRYFKMRALAGYAHVGYNFANASGRPSLSYRFAYFPGDNPDTKAYERWDQLYTGGNGEQWVQGSNMYKVVQNSNEMTHLVQLVHSPAKRLQTVTQLWAFLAPQKNNIGGNPALSTLKSKYYGSEVNVTLKYFHSNHWYFHMNTAITFPGNAIRRSVAGARPWFAFMVFARYSM